jgi:hypothetical protein
LFLRLRNKNLPQEEGSIEVRYAERFPPRKCIIAVTVPINHERIRTVIDVCLAHRRYHYPPIIMNGRDGRRLRLMYRFRNIKPGEHEHLILNARMLAEWAGETFGLPAFVSPFGGLVEARWRLRAFV